MKVLLTAVSLILFIVPATGGQAREGCTVKLPAGSVTNGEWLLLNGKETARSASGGDPALMAFARLTNDIDSADSFYERVSNASMVQEDETLQIVDEDVLFGEALACRGDNCHLVFIRPLTQIAHHWLVLLQRDFQGLEDLGSNTPNGAKFISDLKTAHEQPHSVWGKLSTLYCHLEPEGKYTDLNGSVVLCHDLRH